MMSIPILRRYQLRCGLLQAAHYGTPQARVRFFLTAAKRGLELPSFPQPTHDFPETDGLEIKFPEELAFRPITTLHGVAPHRYVSAHDAISDLPKFDWYVASSYVQAFPFLKAPSDPHRKHPKQRLDRRQMEANRVKECREGQSWCGFHGPDVPYEHEPRTRFQLRCRSRPTQDIQQYTRTYDPKKVERQVLHVVNNRSGMLNPFHELRVVEIPIEADADYRRKIFCRCCSP